MALVASLVDMLARLSLAALEPKYVFLRKGGGHTVGLIARIHVYAPCAMLRPGFNLVNGTLRSFGLGYDILFVCYLTCAVLYGAV